MAVDEAEAVVNQIDVAVPIDIPEERTFASLHHRLIRLVVTETSRYTPGEAPVRPPHQFGGLRSPRPVGLFDAVLVDYSPPSGRAARRIIHGTSLF
jgi:hypothetical protein